MADERPTPKRVTFGDSATTAHLKGALTPVQTRESIKQVEVKMAAQRTDRSTTEKPGKS